MKDHERLLAYLPKSKTDLGAVAGLSKLSMEELKTISSDLLEWTKDSNWPISETICDRLLQLDSKLVPNIKDIFASDDHEWIWHIITPLVSRLTISTQSELLPMVFKYLRRPHGREYDEYLVEYLKTFAERKFGRTLAGGTETDCDATVEVSLLPTEHGGKSKAIRSGYRPQFYYNCSDWDVKLEWVGPEIVKPGESIEARVQFLSPDEHLGCLSPGCHFLIREGQKIVGYGHVQGIENLEFSAIKIASWRIGNQKKYENIGF